jgi:hypothetical protein
MTRNNATPAEESPSLQRWHMRESAQLKQKRGLVRRGPGSPCLEGM